MRIKAFSPHIFWSYKPSADLPEEVVIKQVILYGEIEDKVTLASKLGKERILAVMAQWKNPTRLEEKHIYFMRNVILA